jgi:hypothetical protein
MLVMRRSWRSSWRDFWPDSLNTTTMMLLGAITFLVDVGLVMLGVGCSSVRQFSRSEVVDQIPTGFQLPIQCVDAIVSVDAIWSCNDLLEENAMSLEPSPASEPVPDSPQVEPPASPAPAAPTPVPAAVPPEKPRKSPPRKFWDAAKTITLIVSMFIDLILIVAVVILANQVGAIKMTLNSVLGQLDAAFDGLGQVVITDTIKINQQVPVRSICL